MTIVYSWKNSINGKRYIGQTKHPEQRKRNHLHEAFQKDSDYYFHRALRKYGEDSFTYEILADLGDNPKQSYVDYMENHYIHDYNTIWPNGYNQMYAKALDETAIEKMKKTKRKQFAAMTEEERKELTRKMCESNIGRKHSEESKRKKSESVKEYLKKNPRVLSEETKRKISESVSKARKEKFWSSNKKGGE